MNTVTDYGGIKAEHLFSSKSDEKQNNNEDIKNEEKSKFKENIHAILNSPWFDIATTAVLFAAPIASGPMMASAGKVAPKIGKALKYSPSVVNGITMIKDKIS